MIKLFEDFNSDVVISKMKKDDVAVCLDMKYEHFGKFYKSREQHDKNVLKKLDLNYSLVAKINGDIVGFYFLKKSNFPDFLIKFYTFSKEIKSKTGLRGVSLYVDPKHRGKGIGKKLIDYYRINKEDDIWFIWGGAYHGLNNLEHWEKRRILFLDIFGIYFTIDLLGNDKFLGKETKFYKSYKSDGIGKKISNFTEYLRNI